MEDVVKQRLLALISQHLGKSTADLYANLFKDTDKKACFQITRELLAEFMGEENADVQIASVQSPI